MSKRDKSKLLVNEIASVQPSARWTNGQQPTGQIRVNNQLMDYWMPDGKPIEPMQYGKVEETEADDESIPF